MQNCFQDTDWEKAKLDPRWTFNHDPEVYAYQNYDRAVNLAKKGN
jgi:hypothetical protein